MGKEAEEIIDQYQDALIHSRNHEKALEMTADLFAVDTTTIRVILEDAGIIPRPDFKIETMLNKYGGVMDKVADTYYRELVKKKKEIEAEMQELSKKYDELKKNKEALEAGMQMVEGYAKGVLEYRNAKGTY